MNGVWWMGRARRDEIIRPICTWPICAKSLECGRFRTQSALRFSRLLGAKERQFSIRETDMSSAQWLKNRLIRKWQATNKPTGWGGVLTGSWIRRVRNDWLYWSAVITGQNNKFNLKVLHRSHLTNTAKWAGDTNAWQKWKVHNFPCRLESSGPQIPGFWFPFSSKLF